MYCPFCMNFMKDDEIRCKVCGKEITSYKGEAHHIQHGYILNNRYEIMRVLDEGEFGILYNALDKQSERKVFIKEYFPENDAYRNSEEERTVKACIGSESEFRTKKEKFRAITSAFFQKNEEILFDRELFVANDTEYAMVDFLYNTKLSELVNENRWDEATEFYKELWKKVEEEVCGKVVEKKKKKETDSTTLLQKIKDMSIGGKIGLGIVGIVSIVLMVFAILVITHEHTYSEWLITKMATCTTEGERRRVCDCGAEELEAVPAFGHTSVVDVAVEATCVTDGLTEGSHCSVCNAVLLAQEVIEKTGHTIVIDKAVEATCTINGLTEGSHCSVCDEVIIKQDSIPKLKHDVKEGSCIVCGDGASEGLKYVLKEDNTYEVSKVGTCKDTIIVIPSIYNGKPVTSIGANAFYDCNKIIAITIPSTITIIDVEAFSGCSSLKSIAIPSSVKEIEKKAFYQCTALTSVTFPSKLERIGTYAFAECTSLKKVTIPASVKNMDSYIFAECSKLETVIISEGVKSIGAGDFYKCEKLKNVTLPSTLTKIEKSAFEDCESLKKIVIPISVKTVEKNAFAKCDGLRVYAEAEKKPSGWNNAWKTYWVRVTWRYDGDN